jgi:Arc/MetJ-type ribon-helix-helix transcriptional regulator
MEGTVDMEMTTVQTKLPTRLLTQMQSLVSEGWFQDVNDLILDALRRFLETHRPELMEHYIWEDVKWGLHGEE